MEIEMQSAVTIAQPKKKKQITPTHSHIRLRKNDTQCIKHIEKVRQREKNRKMEQPTYRKKPMRKGKFEGKTNTVMCFLLLFSFSSMFMSKLYFFFVSSIVVVWSVVQFEYLLVFKFFFCVLVFIELVVGFSSYVCI